MHVKECYKQLSLTQGMQSTLATIAILAKQRAGGSATPRDNATARSLASR
jgi:hypothetical protein